MAFRLKRNGAALKQGAIVQLRFCIFQDSVSIDDMLDRFAASNLDLHRYPLVSMVGLALAADAVTLQQFLVHHDVRTRRAQVGRSSLAGSFSAQKNLKKHLVDPNWAVAGLLVFERFSSSNDLFPPKLPQF